MDHDTVMDEIPVLVYDGDCGICREYVQYWRELTGDRVQYYPYQEKAADYPHIPLQDFQQSIQLIGADGSVKSGAEATFELCRGVAPYSLLRALYRYLPGFRFASEAGYRFFSTHRGLLAFLTHLFWGRDHRPSRYELCTRIFLVALGLVYLSAFFSFSLQSRGLIGADGILPLHFFIERVSESLGEAAWLQVPMVFWINASDPAIQLVAICGCILSLLLIFNIQRTVVLILLFVLYLSLYYAGQVFMAFQWDLYLLEAGFLAIFLGRGSHIVVWLYRWLLFRFMFMGGLVKLAGRDPAWDGLTALNYHFETQPLPTPLAWHAHHLPESVLMTLVALTLFIELVVPFLIFTPRRIRFIAAWLFIVFQCAIILTGNYNFFNLLTVAICLFLFDDAAMKRVIPARLKSGTPLHASGQANSSGIVARSVLAAILVFASVEQMTYFAFADQPRELSIINRMLFPLNVVNNYGPFAIMTKIRHEIMVEGSNDGVNWREYPFRYKPDTLDDLPGWIIPHQPRLDWQMWFAALSSAEREVWFRRFLYQLLEGRTRVLDLLESDPFAGSHPVFVRALLYRYEFTSPAERSASGHVWKREYVRVYQPVLRLRSGP